MHSKILSHDEEADRTRIFHWDPASGTAVIETIQRCDDLVAINKDEYASINERATWSDGLGDRIASIPMTLFMQLQASGLTEDKKAFKKFLNDRDNLYFRTRPGTL